MKVRTLFWLSILAMALLPAFAQVAQGDDLFTIAAPQTGLLKKSRQVIQLYLEEATGDWKYALPDGTTRTYSWGKGNSFVMTGLYVKFYANTTDTQPYRIYFKAPNGNNLWIDNLEALTYPTTGGTVWGGTQSESFTPGIVMAVKPSIKVQHLPAPPASPNSGEVIAGAVYLCITGYTVP
jgi:hypothetical protein